MQPWRELAQDIRYGARMLARSPASTALVVLTLALGIGANTAIFSILDAVLLRPLPYKDAGRLVAVWESNIREQGYSKIFTNYTDFEHFERKNSTFEQLAAATWATGSRLLTGAGPAREVLAIPVSVDFFSLLGVAPELGRTFERRDMAGGCTLVLAHRFWREVLASPHDFSARTLRLDGRACKVAGVMPAAFSFYPRPAQMWLLMAPGAGLESDPEKLLTGIFGRLKPGVSLAAAQAELQALHRSFRAGEAHGSNVVPVVYPLQEEFTWLAGRNLRRSLMVLFAAVVLVLIIACVNVAGLLLGRSQARLKETAIRSALGSGQGRLFRQLLTESALLSIMGAAAGLLLALFAIDGFRAANPVELPPGNAVSVNFPVLAFTALLAVLATLLFGVFPAWRTARADANEVLKSGGGGRAAGGRQGARKVLVAAQISCSLILLAGASLLIQSLMRLTATPLGFDPVHLLTTRIRLPRGSYSEPARRVRFYEQLLARAGALPGVQGAALTSMLPPGGSSNNSVAMEGRPAPTPATAVHDTAIAAVSTGYFRVMGIRLISGRWFDARDAAKSEPAAVINQALARKYFPDVSPVGKRIRSGQVEDLGPWLVIAGVVENTRQNTVYREMGWAEPPMLFRPLGQDAPEGVTLVLRTPAARVAMAGAVQREIAALDAAVPIAAGLDPMEQILARYLAYPRFRAILLGAFAALALLLALIGIYALLSQLVRQRTQEIGVRVALGASSGEVQRLVVRQGMLLAIVGTAAGLAGAWLLAPLVASLLFGIEATDPVTLAGAAALLLAAAFLASWTPARRAARIDPIQALRYE